MRPECAGTKDDGSDRCDLYDSEGWCHWYGDTWKDDDGVFRGGEDVEHITYCTHRTINGKRINDAMNPLHMERIPRWNEVVFDGEVRMIRHSFYNPDGIIVHRDGTMHDPVSKKTIFQDGTILENDMFEGDNEKRKSDEMLMDHIRKVTKKIKEDNSVKPYTRRIMESATVDKTHRCWGWFEKHNAVCHLCRFGEQCYVEKHKREKGKRG
jgi:hypothetical protein